jgi:hypothetical protein
MMPEFSDVMPDGILLRKRIASVAARVKAFYLQLPIIYIHATGVTVTLLSALGGGLIMPWWTNQWLLFSS